MTTVAGVPPFHSGETHAPGRRGPLPAHRTVTSPRAPLRTVRDRVPSYGSSRSKPPRGSRSCRSSAWPPRVAGADDAPTEVSVGSCPSRARRDSNPSIPGVIGQHPSRGERPVGRQRTFVPGYSTPIHPMTGWPWLLPTSSTRTPIGSPYGSRSQREMYGVPTFRSTSMSG